jgi:hypothetical protein
MTLTKEPRYKITSQKGLLYHEMADITTLIRIVDIPESEHLAVYTCQVGQKFKFKFKQVLFVYFFNIERVM